MTPQCPSFHSKLKLIYSYKQDQVYLQNAAVFHHIEMQPCRRLPGPTDTQTEGRITS